MNVPRCPRCKWPMLKTLYGWLCESPKCFSMRHPWKKVGVNPPPTSGGES